MLLTIRRFLTRNQYRREITLVVCLKLALILLLWMVCFSGSHERMTSQNMTQRLM